jgi:hypothetical protein
MSHPDRLTAAPTVTVSINDAKALAKRLLARGISALSTSGGAEKTDLRLAGLLLLLLLEDYREQESLQMDAG